MFALLGGALGLHKLYLKDASGVMFYLFLIFISSAIGLFPFASAMFGVFDALKLLFMSEQDFNRKYNHGYVHHDGQLEKRREQQMRTYETKDVSTSRQQPLINIKSNPFKTSGLSKYKEFDLEAAVQDFKKALEINPNDYAIHFHLACVYSLTEKKEESFYHLSRAVALGFNDLDRILTHDDLSYLRIQPEFEQFKKNGFRSAPKPHEVATASAGGQRQQNASPEINKPTEDVLLAQLNRLSELRKKGILSEEEFLIERKKIMRS